MKKHQKFIVTITLLLAIMVSGFYWLEMRPAKFRKACVDKTFEQASKSESVNATAADLTLYFKLCLWKYGIKE